MIRAVAIAAGLSVALAACSARPLPADLGRAESAERAGRHDEALAAYRDAQRSCKQVRPEWRRRQMCAAARLQRAALLERMGRAGEAAAAYEAIPEALADDPASGARALYRAGRLHLELGDDEHAWELLWRVVTHYPDEPHAGDALRVLVIDGRRRDARALYEVLDGLVEPLIDSRAGDNVLWALAQLAEDELADPQAALAHLDRLVAAYPSKKASGLFDEALWHGARLARALGDPGGAVERYRRLLATYEVAMGVGSYFSVWLDDAQLALGQVLRDDLEDYQGALAAFARLPQDYPDSILHDDAQWETAVTRAAMGEPAEACAALEELRRRWPDSKFELAKAPELRAELGCQQ